MASLMLGEENVSRAVSLAVTQISSSTTPFWYLIKQSSAFLITQLRNAVTLNKASELTSDVSARRSHLYERAAMVLARRDSGFVSARSKGSVIWLPSEAATSRPRLPKWPFRVDLRNLVVRRRKTRDPANSGPKHWPAAAAAADYRT